MKKTAYIIGFVLSLVCGPTLSRAQGAQESISVYDGRISVTPIELKQRGRDLRIALRVESQKNAVDSREAVRLTPVLVGANGQSLRLAPMRINGRNEQKAYRRSEVLGGNRDNYFTDNTLVVRSGERIDYRQTVRYRPWMADAHLDVIEEICGCGSDWAEMSINGLADSLDLQRQIEPYQPDLQYSYLLPEGTANENPLLMNVYLEFPVNRTQIRRDFRDNARKLDAVNYTAARISSAPDADAVSRIEILGYASPEGPETNNENLAEGRAEAFRDYLAARMRRFPNNIYAVSDGGEDWHGLDSLLEHHPAGRDPRVRAILAEPDPADRKRMLAALDGGSVYARIHSELYPLLRRVTCRVFFNRDAVTYDDRPGRIEGQAEEMNLLEMYRLAQAYPYGSRAFGDVLESAAKVYTADPVANLNAASAALARGDLAAAERYLKRVRGTEIPETDNVAGCIAMQKGDYTAAERLFRKAQRNGVVEAEHNMEELHKKLENIRAIKAEKTR